ncbi:fkbM_fam, methyltransferase, FkbM family [uncultured Caudovirales phage]|uniref:FkbM_fam, methyltransferase, FkbM family n=1 Tax=uncultured Caudovirales phage TaxID=2100421 RepID=A0A6J5KWG6_9CAUD|nr:fkbM_fam, methyltransferase, FkbM family [uncultured Caudovirales phage]
MAIIIEVGANKGTDTENFLKDSNNQVFAFEPTPELHLELKNKFKNLENYYPVPLAVDVDNGWTWFNIAGSGDWGCSSIYNFNPNIHQEWQDRPDFKVTDRCRVQTTRLDTFMETYNIPGIDYLWIDAQGNDFRVLQSLGDKIHLVKEGKCEAAHTVNLYSEVDNTEYSIVSWLTDKGFECMLHRYNGKETDIHFRKL